MEKNHKDPTRKKFLFWSMVSIASLGLFKLLKSTKQEKPRTIKMLSEYGKLVEVEIDKIKSTGNKISDTEVHDWISPSKI
jgi:hypothetical protein